MLSHILKYTNQHAAAHYARKKVQWDPIDMIELKDFVGILYLLGVSKENHENIRNLWSDGPMARPVFEATTSVNRFEIIRCHLRFDSIDTREERRARDKFAPFRKLWNFFESKCRENYKPLAEVCIDEQLIPFRGWCPFRQYMPSKPDKYGMQLFLLVDCNTGYVYTGQPYVGKVGNEITQGLAAKVVKSQQKPCTMLDAILLQIIILLILLWHRSCFSKNYLRWHFAKKQVRYSSRIPSQQKTTSWINFVWF